MHRLSNVYYTASQETRGDCEECGFDVEVRLRKAGTGRPHRWRCLTGERNSYKSRHHGMTYNEMAVWKAQAGNRCEICGFTERLCVDHDHATGAVRGVLCNYCNTGLYLVERDITWGALAVAYLVERDWKWNGSEYRSKFN